MFRGQRALRDWGLHGPDMRFRLVFIVHVPQEQAYAWWTSFSDEDGNPEGPLLSRGIRLKGQNQLLLEDEYLYLGRRLRLRGSVRIEPPDSYTVDYEGRLLRVWLRYMFAPVAEGTQLVVLGEVRGNGWLRLLLPFLWMRIKREIAAGIESNVRRMEGPLEADTS